MTAIPSQGTPGDAPVVGDHLALDLLNTRALTPGGDPVDYWTTGEDVIRWLDRNRLPTRAGPTAIPPATLFAEAKALRSLAERLIIGRREGDETTGAIELNRYLHAHPSTPHLELDQGRLVLARRACGEGAAALLGPVAEAVAGLLAEDDFTRVKQCEHPECILWFYDRTKARRRRWCSMALCGNRQKAARFRKRAAAAIHPPSAGGTRP